jgi:lysophospholipase L1-like esterase
MTTPKKEQDSAATEARYYLSIGDSLAVGVQPAAVGGREPTADGFADRLADTLQQHVPNLRLVKLGCDGETTTTMLDGGCCPYPHGSQLDEATAFLDAHRGEVALITLTIGANEIVNCERDGAIDLECLQAGFATAETNLPRILAAIRAVAGTDTPIVGGNLYNPFLVRWFDGESGQALARASALVQAQYNALLDRIYTAADIIVADVAAAFTSSDFDHTATIADDRTVPLNVARICEWTWMRRPPPHNPDVHPNAAGYRAIAGAFERVLEGIGP